MKSSAEVFDRIASRLSDREGEVAVSHGILVANLAPGGVLAAARLLRDELGFDVFLDVTAIDWPGQDPRFEGVWHFYSTSHKVRVRVKTRVPESNPSVPSLTPLYGSAAFMERECHEMYGIGFEGNADLRPLLLYEGFVGHPLRKDYPKEREQPLVAYRPGFELGERG